MEFTINLIKNSMKKGERLYAYDLEGIKISEPSTVSEILSENMSPIVLDDKFFTSLESGNTKRIAEKINKFRNYVNIEKNKAKFLKKYTALLELGTEMELLSKKLERYRQNILLARSLERVKINEMTFGDKKILDNVKDNKKKFDAATKRFKELLIRARQIRYEKMDISTVNKFEQARVDFFSEEKNPMVTTLQSTTMVRDVEKPTKFDFVKGNETSRSKVKEDIKKKGEFIQD